MNDIRDVKPTVAAIGIDLPNSWLFWVIVIVILAVIIFLVIFFRRKKTEPVLPPKTAWEKALEKVDILERKQLAQKGEYKSFYSELSDILRQYIEERFLISAPEMTTEEFLSAPSTKAALADKQRKDLADFLTHCDMVKFAKFQSDVAQAETSLKLVRQLIVETKAEKI
ncbi:MAG: hypothetical protein HQL25_05760 [Candidatus Omnitrophica bacterium]|nr:hypothetical protein [Candidatus Omnitrophota bacterium]